MRNEHHFSLYTKKERKKIKRINERKKGERKKEQKQIKRIDQRKHGERKKIVRGQKQKKVRKIR